MMTKRNIGVLVSVTGNEDIYVHLTSDCGQGVMLANRYTQMPMDDTNFKRCMRHY